MFEKFKIKKNFRILFVLKRNTEIVALSFLIIITIISTTYYNNNKKKVYSNYKNIINNVYLKKTINHLFDNLEPRFKIINHKISSGETFDNILRLYSVKDKEIVEIKKQLSNKINLNKLNTEHKIKFTLDQSNNLIKDFTFQISNKEKVYLKRDTINNQFNQKILVTKLKKDIIYKENSILQSLYKSASDQKIPANVIIEFARIYGFQVDFQRDIRKRDSFQILFEIFKDDNGKVIETGEILFANLKLSGSNNSLYFFNKEGSRGHYDKNGKSVKNRYYARLSIEPK